LENRDQEGTRNNPLGYNHSMLNRLKYLGVDFSQAEMNFVKIREFDANSKKWVKVLNLRSPKVVALPGYDEPWHTHTTLRRDMAATQLIRISEVDRVLREAVAKPPAIDVAYHTGIGAHTPFDYEGGEWTIGAYEGRERGVDGEGQPTSGARL